MFFFNTHVPEFCYDQDFTALKPEDILGWARGKLLFSNPTIALKQNQAWKQNSFNHSCWLGPLPYI